MGITKEAEERILQRENNNREVIAELGDGDYTPISLKEFRKTIKIIHGGKAWYDLVLREKERILTERWAKRNKDA